MTKQTEDLTSEVFLQGCQIIGASIVQAATIACVVPMVPGAPLKAKRPDEWPQASRDAARVADVLDAVAYRMSKKEGENGTL